MGTFTEIVKLLLSQQTNIQTDLQGVSKKRNLFDLEYLKDGFVKLVVLLVFYTVLPYNFVEPDFEFLQ